MAGVSKCIADSNPPADLKDQVAAVVAAMGVVVADLDTALKAAQAGDLENVDKWVTQMHDVDQPKIDDAVNSVKQAAGG